MNRSRSPISFANSHSEDSSEIVFRRLSPALESELADFFALLTSRAVDLNFHPHPFDAIEAHRRACYSGDDEYWVAVHQHKIVAYGMLRGWDEGYEVPSLGIAVDPGWQRRGIGRRMMQQLHEIARERGATQIRLKVYRQNERAVSMYRALGYDFADYDREQLAGVVTL